jgi:hypothetical protein
MNVPGRGYSFVAPVEVLQQESRPAHVHACGNGLPPLAIDAHGSAPEAMS